MQKPSAWLESSGLKHLVVVNDRAVPKGGASTVALRSAAALASSGLPVTLFAGGSDVWPELDAAGVETVLTQTTEIGDERNRPLAAVNALWNRRAANDLRALLDQLPQSGTIVHIHSWGKGLSPSIFDAAKRSGMKIALTLHDYGFVCPNAGLHVFPTGLACTLKPMSPSCVVCNCDARSRLHKMWRVARQLSLEHAAQAPRAVDRLIAVTNYAADVYRPLLPHQAQLSIIPNPIDVQDKGPADPAANRDIVFVGRLSQEKGALILADAANRLGLAPVFVGTGELAHTIQERCPAATITGWLNRDGVTEKIRAARAIVLPATWRETQGMVVPEALANGVPVVVSSNTAPASVITDGSTGLIFENGSVDDLARTLALLADDALVGRLGREAYNSYWKAPADMSQHLNLLLALYDEMIALPRPADPSTASDQL